MDRECELYGTKELAELFDVKPQTITMWVARKKLPVPMCRLACGPVWHKDQIIPLIEEKLHNLSRGLS